MATTQNQSKIAEKYDFIDEWLPTRYTSSVNLILKKKKPAAYIRQVKRERIHNKTILAALYQVAKFNKMQLEN